MVEDTPDSKMLKQGESAEGGVSPSNRGEGEVGVSPSNREEGEGGEGVEMMECGESQREQEGGGGTEKAKREIEKKEEKERSLGKKAAPFFSKYHSPLPSATPFPFLPPSFSFLHSFSIPYPLPSLPPSPYLSHCLFFCSTKS